jgi:hypothetical protein
MRLRCIRMDLATVTEDCDDFLQSLVKSVGLSLKGAASASFQIRIYHHIYPVVQHGVTYATEKISLNKLIVITILSEELNLSVSFRARSGPGAHPMSCPVGTWCPFSGGGGGVKRPCLWGDHSHLSNWEVNKEWRFSSTAPYVAVVTCLVWIMDDLRNKIIII